MIIMFTLHIEEGKEGVFKNPSDAIKFMEETNYVSEISVYDVDSDKAYKETNEIYKAIKDYNKGKLLDDQILPSNPFGFRGILGCLGVQVYSISLGTYKENREVVPLFTGWNTNVLDKSMGSAEVRPGLKALSSLAMMARMWEGK